MNRLILLPGWGLGPAALQPLVDALNGLGLPSELAELPAPTSSDPEVWLAELDARLPVD
jgi:pimeloyl-[acyl-carrier protein] methyl ester esterase